MNPRRQRVTDTQLKPCTGNNPGGASQILTQPVEQTTNRRAPEQATTRDNTFAQSQVAHQTKCKTSTAPQQARLNSGARNTLTQQKGEAPPQPTRQPKRQTGLDHTKSAGDQSGITRCGMVRNRKAAQRVTIPFFNRLKANKPAPIDAAEASLFSQRLTTPPSRGKCRP